MLGSSWVTRRGPPCLNPPSPQANRLPRPYIRLASRSQGTRIGPDARVARARSARLSSGCPERAVSSTLARCPVPRNASASGEVPAQDDERAPQSAGIRLLLSAEAGVCPFRGDVLHPARSETRRRAARSCAAPGEGVSPSPLRWAHYCSPGMGQSSQTVPGRPDKRCMVGRPVCGGEAQGSAVIRATSTTSCITPCASG